MLSTVEPAELQNPFHEYTSGTTWQNQISLDVPEDRTTGIDPVVRRKGASPSGSSIETCGPKRVSASKGTVYTVWDQPSESSFDWCPGSPFDDLDEMQADDVKAMNLIGFLRRESSLPFAAGLSDRLSALHEMLCEDPDESPISVESLRSFIGFIQTTPNLRAPDIVLTPSNEIRAQWRTAPNRHFAVAFTADGDARYVIFTPNRRDPDRIDRLSGITSVDSLMETTQPHRILDWASQ